MVKKIVKKKAAPKKKTITKKNTVKKSVSKKTVAKKAKAKPVVRKAPPAKIIEEPKKTEKPKVTEWSFYQSFKKT